MNTKLSSDLLSHDLEMAKQGCIVGTGVFQRVNLAFRDDQNVDRSLAIDVMERQA
jgi:hypothetical protein